MVKNTYLITRINNNGDVFAVPVPESTTDAAGNAAARELYLAGVAADGLEVGSCYEITDGGKVLCEVV